MPVDSPPLQSSPEQEMATHRSSSAPLRTFQQPTKSLAPESVPLATLQAFARHKHTHLQASASYYKGQEICPSNATIKGASLAPTRGGRPVSVSRTLRVRAQTSALESSTQSLNQFVHPHSKFSEEMSALSVSRADAPLRRALRRPKFAAAVQRCIPARRPWTAIV